MQLSNCGKFTLTKQTMSALIQTLTCTADLIEDLLQEGFDYVLVSRLQSDPFERRFSKYRQMGGGRFLVALREVLCSEKILQMKSLLKENLNLWELDVRPEGDILNITENVEFQNDFEEIDLDDDSKEVATYIAGYITKKLLKKSTGELCRKILSDDQVYFQEEVYAYQQIHLQPMCAEVLQNSIWQRLLLQPNHVRKAAEMVLRRDSGIQKFMCHN